MSGAITTLQRDQGAGTLLGEDRKRYTFRRYDVRAVWFHDLTEGDCRLRAWQEPFGDPSAPGETISVILCRMFLRFTNRKKDGKEHRYFSVVENRRVSSGKTVQRTVVYLGEINDSQQTAWLKTLDVFDEQEQRSRALCLFPEDREIPEGANRSPSGEGERAGTETGRARSATVGWRASCGGVWVWRDFGRSDCGRAAKR